MAWKNFLWGFWNGITAWAVLIAHLFGGWKNYPLYDTKRRGGWYDFGFLLGASLSLLRSSGRSRGRGLAKAPAKVKSEEAVHPEISKENQAFTSI